MIKFRGNTGRGIPSGVGFSEKGEDRGVSDEKFRAVVGRVGKGGAKFLERRDSRPEKIAGIGLRISGGGEEQAKILRSRRICLKKVAGREKSPEWQRGKDSASKGAKISNLMRKEIVPNRGKVRIGGGVAKVAHCKKQGG